MFGLTQREQRWAAEQRAAELLVDVACAAIKASADIQVAEAQSDASELKALRAENKRLKEEEHTSQLHLERMTRSRDELRAKLSALEGHHDLPPLPFLTWTRLYKTDELIEIATAYGIQSQAVIRAKLEGQEPVGYVYSVASNPGEKSAALSADIPNGTPLYTAAGAKGEMK